MSEIKTKRNSSIEALRIISMLLIIAQHYVVHGGYSSEAFMSFTPNVVFLKILTMFGYSACTIFALITGYYYINLDTDRKYYRRLLYVIGQCLFYSLIIYVIMTVINGFQLSLRELINALFPYFYGNWYFVFYLVLLLFVPYINVFLKSLDEKQYRNMLIVVFVLFVLIQTFFGNIYSLNNLDFMFMAYIYGAYYRLYKERFTYSNNKNLLYAILCFVLICLSVIVFDYAGVLLNNDKFIKYDYYFMSWYSLPSFLFSLFAFMYACNRQSYNKIINLFASSVFGVYLIHDSNLKTVIWEKISPNVNYFNNPYLHAFIKIILVFVICAIIDIIRQKTIGKYINRKISSLCDRLSEKYEINL